MRDKAQLLKRLVMIVAVTVITLMLRTDSEAATYWEDSFDPPASLTNWDIAGTGGNPTITPALPFDGTHSLWGRYTGLDSGGYMDRRHPTTEDLWTRFYYRTTNFTYNDVGTKHFNVGDSVHYPNFWLMHIGASREFSFIAQAPAEDCGLGPYDSCSYPANVTHVPINDNQWYCIEGHLKMNTPGVANGVVEFWVDGVQTTNYQNRLFRGSLVNGTNGNSSQATFSFVRVYVQHGVGDMYYDRFAVGDTRIPCVGAASPAGLTPTPPTNPQVR